uniref:Uncharacterized protein n=1 Tax=Trichobilharzia regenti TaxID=157069 RepID=A0AA85K9Q8_TRIRE|nr:unnamed protein product [Trichobilharzia regenti]
MDHVSKENKKLLEENSGLKAKLHELLCQREELLARCEAEKLAKENSLIRNQGCVSGAPSGESCRVEFSCSGMSPPSSPDSFQPGVDTRTEVPVSNDLGFGEGLASFVTVNNHLKGLGLAVLKAESEYQSMKKKFILQKFISLVLRAVVRHRGSVIDNSKHLIELLNKEISRRNSQINGRLGKLIGQVSNAEVRLNDTKEAVTEMRKRQCETISELCGENRRLTGELGRIQETNEVVLHKWENEVDCLMAENQKLSAEIERLKNTLATSASEYESVVSLMTDKHRREKNKLLSDIKLAEDSKEMGLLEAGRLKALLEDTKNELSDEKEKAIQASTLSRVFKNEVAELRCDLSKTRENLLEAEESLRSSNELVDRLQAMNKDLTVKLSAAENSCSMKEKDICRLVTQIVELESKNKRSSEKIGELECFVESATGVQKDLEHQCGVFRKQMSEMEAGWLSTRQQLTVTREQLMKMEELLHVHRLRLLRSELEKNELCTRLELIGRKSEVEGTELSDVYSARRSVGEVLGRQTDSETISSQTAPSPKLSCIPESPEYLLNSVTLPRTHSAHELATVPLEIRSGRNSSLAHSATTSFLSRNHVPMVDRRTDHRHKTSSAKRLHIRLEHAASYDSEVKVSRFAESYPEVKDTSKETQF